MTDPDETSTTPVAIGRRHPLTPAQRALWASQQRAPESPVQNMAWLTHLDGAIDGGRLASAFASVVAAHDALRTRFVVDDSGATVVTLDPTTAPTETIEIPRADADEWARRRVATPLSMTHRPHDSVLLVHEDGTSSWYLDLHHCVTDATSSAIVFAQTARAYAGDAVDGSSFYRWAADAAVDTDLAAVSSFWRDRPAAPRIGELLATPSSDGSSTRAEVDLDAMTELVEAALDTSFRSVSRDSSWTTLLMTATAALLHRLSGAHRFAIGLPVHNRSNPEATSVVGPLVDVVPVDVAIEPEDSFATLARRLGRSLRRSLVNARPGITPGAADVEAVVNVIPESDLRDFAGTPADVRWIHAGASDPGHLLRVQLDRVGGSTLVLDVNDGAADGRAPQLAGHLRTVLAQVLADPDARLDSFSLTTDLELESLERWGDGGSPPATEHVAVALERALAQRADIALIDGERSWTGSELWEDARQVARTLATRGVNRGDRVAVELERSADAVRTILGCVVAGASYVPIDPRQPAIRRDRLVERAACVARLADAAHLEERASAADDPSSDPGAPRSLDDEAYLLFTSGSTGEPKGVPITHRGLADYLAFATSSYTDGGEPPVVALFSALTFDLTVTSLFVPLLVGGRQVVFRGDGAAAILDVAADRSITWCKATPSHLELLERNVVPGHGLRTLVVGGEAFSSSLARRLRARLPELRIFNEYGPTEAVVGCMLHEWSDDDDSVDVPIGRPAPGVRLRVVDPNGRPAVPGAPGELQISSRGLTSGYLDDDRSAFIEEDDRTWYRSGDLVRLLGNGDLVYLRRTDEQLKVGGIRLDPSEIEAALTEHPGVRRAVVRSWSPSARESTHRCVRCGLADDVPGVQFDSAGICDRCRAYDEISVQAAAWFRTPDDLVALRDRARARRTGAHDCVALLSGGKDSTYALFQLVAHGFDVHALTLDNGFISNGAKDNVRRSVEALGIDHDFVTPDGMNVIFRDSLARHSNVCHGCFKTVYTVGTNRAAELGAPLVVTGLSRGQLFETRLIPSQFTKQRFDPDAIDDAVVAARRAYHRADDAVRRVLDTTIFDDEDVFEQIEYVDFYRYVDVPLSEMLRFLDDEAPWVRPADTGRSTNCLINAAGISTHLFEQGYHNYAEPYAWDVRLGHKQRDEALAELDDRDDPDEIARMLEEVGYVPRRRELLTAWFDVPDGVEPPTAAVLRSHLQRLLPDHAVPAAYVAIDELPTTENGKLDDRRLPAPERIGRSSPTVVVEPTSAVERTIVELWSRQLGIDAVSVDDDFFALGGDSLAALEVTIVLGDALGVDLPDAAVFSNPTPRRLADAIDLLVGEPVGEDAGPSAGLGGSPPESSDAERALVFEHRDAPDDPRYQQGRLYRIRRSLDVDRLRDAIATVVTRHEPLHWTFASPRRELDVDTALDFDAVDVETWDEAVDSAQAVHRMPIDPTIGPLVRSRLLRLPDGTGGILISTHHVSADAASFDSFWAEIDAAYHGDVLAPVAISHSDHAAWQARRHTTADTDFWLDVPIVDDVGGLGLANRGADGTITRSTGLGADELSRRGGAPFAAVLAAAAITIRHFVDRASVTLGALVSTRDHPAADGLIGYHQNTLPITIDVDPESTLDELVRQAGARLAAALDHRTYPLARQVADRRAADLAVPTFDALVALQSLHDTEFGGLAVTQEILSTGSAVADATMFVQLRDHTIDVAIEHRGRTIGPEPADRLLRGLELALTATLRHPATTIGDLDPFADGRSVVSGPPGSPGAHVVEQIQRHARDRSTDTAVVVGDDDLTWGELGERSRHLAARLIAAGVEPGDRVLTYVPRSTDLVVAIVGVLLSGAAYVPVDPEYPAGRNRSIVTASGASAAVTVSDRFDDDTLDGVDRIVIDTAIDTVDNATNAVVLPATDRRSPAYVIFTSGSTGRPRAVEIDHDRLARSVAARLDAYDDSAPRFLVVSSIAFDSSIAGLFWALARGGSVVMPTDDQVHDPDALIGLFARAAPTHTLMVPSLYRGLLRRALPDSPWPRQVIVAGEGCGPEVVELHHERHPGSRLTNEYGPTEATVWSTVAHLDRDDGPVPIGLPIAGTWAAVVDAAGRPVPIGVRGELVVGGPTVAEGYDDAEDSAASDRFTATSELGPGRSFRTGDLATYDGARLWFHGRVDDQLNIGAVRIEPGEIEAAIRAVASVDDAVVLLADLRPLGERLDATDTSEVQEALRAAAAEGDPVRALRRRLTDPRHGTLVAVVTPNETEVDVDGLRRHLAAQLPAPSRPTQIIVRDTLPRSANGKVDRAAVSVMLSEEEARPAAPEPISGTGAPVDVVQAMLSTVLDQPIGPDDDFFEAGGNSLLALELFLMIEQRFGTRPQISILFESRTARALAEVLGTTDSMPTGTAIVVRPGAEGSVPVWFWPGADGALLVLERLAAALDDTVTILGVEYAGTRGEQQPSSTVDQLADHCLAALLRAQPEGPYRMIGYSLGGLVAVEVARRLRSNGHEVEFIVAIESGLAGAADPRTTRAKLVDSWRAEGPAVAARRTARSLRTRANVVGRRVRDRVETSAIDRFGIRPSDRLLFSRMQDHLRSAGLEYHPPELDVDVIVCLGEDASPSWRAAMRREWSTVAPSSLELVTVDGSHVDNSMLFEPAVASLAEVVDARLRRTDPDDD